MSTRADADQQAAPKVVVDLRSKPKTGIYRYSLRLMEPADGWCFEPLRTLGCGEDERVSRVKAILRMMYEFFCLPFVLKRRRADIFHCTKNFGLPFFSFGVKRVLTVMDIIPLKFSDYAPNLFFRCFYFCNLWLSCRAADQIICISHFTAEELARRFHFTRAKIHVVPLGVDCAHFSSGEAEVAPLPAGIGTRPFILTIGGTEPRKNVAAVMELFQRGELADCDLVVIGGEWKDRPFPVAMRSNPRIHLVGMVSEAELVALYRRAALFVFASVYEGFGLPPLEVMAAGTPVVAARTSCLPEILGDAAEWFDPAVPGELLRAIKRVLDDPVRRENLIGSGRRRAAEFPWEKTLLETRKVWRALVPETRRRGR